MIVSWFNNSDLTQSMCTLGRHTRQEALVQLHGRADLLDSHRGYLHHDESRLRWAHRVAGEPQGSLQVL